MPGIRSLYSGGINATYRCTAACGHCLPASSPKRDRAYISRETAREVLRELTARGVTSLHIGGGEPFLDFEGLCALLEEIRAARVSVEYVETNAYWASGKETDAEKLKRIRSLGAGAVMFSLCPYHAAFIPLARVKNAIRAARAAGMEYFVYQTQFAREVEALGAEDRAHSLAEYEARFPGGVGRLPSRFGVRMGGRAALTHASLGARKTEDILAGSKPCDVSSRTQHFHADVYGRFVPSGCNGLSVPLAELSAFGGPGHPALHLLMNKGVAALVAQAREAGFVPDEAYPSECGLCQHARAALAQAQPERWPDLAPLDFYQELFGGKRPCADCN